MNVTPGGFGDFVDDEGGRRVGCRRRIPTACSRRDARPVILLRRPLSFRAARASQAEASTGHNVSQGGCRHRLARNSSYTACRYAYPTIQLVCSLCVWGSDDGPDSG